METTLLANNLPVRTYEHSRGLTTVDDALIVRIKNCTFTISGRTRQLLFISDDLPPAPDQPLFTISIYGLSVPEPLEPSTIYTKLNVDAPVDPHIVYRPDYGPRYYILTPEQRWIYLSWLQDVRQPVDIGYVFLYFYGLERHLAVGNFDLAFDEIELLQKYHHDQSFDSYSDDALVLGCILHKRLDRLLDNTTGSPLIRLSTIRLYAAYRLGCDLSARDVMMLADWVRGVNKRYIRSNPDLFLTQLTDCMHTRFGKPYMPFAGQYNLDEPQFLYHGMFANPSVCRKAGKIKVPCFDTYKPFCSMVNLLLAEAHEKTKTALRQIRKKKRAR